MRKLKELITNFINGFCMALADSVPGVSGGTVAFILGFYDNFINALDDLFRGNWEAKKKALLKYFGSVEKIRNSSIEEIVKVNGINGELAKNILQQLN